MKRQHDMNGAPGRKFADPTPTRLTLIPEGTRDSHVTPGQHQALHAVYDLIAEVASRVRSEEMERAA